VCNQLTNNSKYAVSFIRILRYLYVITCLSAFSSAWAMTSYEKMLQAVEDGDYSEVKLLLDRGIDPNTTDPRGLSVLMIAAHKGDAKIVGLLIERRANVGRRTAAGDTALLMAALNGDVTVIGKLLDAGAEINPAKGWAPLHYAAFAGNAAAVKLLLERGANKDAIAPNGYTALMLAARNGKIEAARAILYVDPDVNFKSVSGETALSVAHKRERKDMEALLRQAGAVK
jgi:ankyrin repeat protein